VVFDSNGSYYGTTSSGACGAATCGTVFKLPTILQPPGERIYAFHQSGIDGVDPRGRLYIDSAGALYGTTSITGPAGGSGTIFKLTPSGSQFASWPITILYSFSPTDEGEPVAGMIADASGALYGTATGGPSGTGSVWAFVQAPAVTGVAASSGTTFGGTALTITGSGFTGATGVTLGGTAATNVVVVNDITITATTPAHSAGAVDVAVTTFGGTATATGGYTYVAEPSATTLGTSATPSTFGQSVTLTATVTAGTTGTVTFTIDGVNQSSPVSGGTATYRTTALNAGNHTVTAAYSGDEFYAASTSSALTQVVNKADQTIGFTSALPANPRIGGTYIPAATATSGLAVTFGASGACSFAAGTVTFTAAGPCTVAASQAGDGNYNAASQAMPPFTINKGVTTLTQTASPAFAKPGQAVTLKATVAVTAPAVATPTGSVTFKEGTKTLGSGPVASNAAHVATSALMIGNHVISASYGGDTNLIGSTAGATVKVGAAVGGETKVNTTTAGAQQLPAVAALKSGYVIAWASSAQDKSGYGVYMQRYTSAGAKAGHETLVNTTKTGDQTMPAVAGLKSGGFVVVWQSANEDKSGLGVYGQIFTAAGAKSGAEFRVNTTTSGDQSLPSVASLASGGFVVAWTSKNQDRSGLGVYAQMYDAKGKASGKEFKVNTTTAGDQTNAAVAGLTSGGFVIAWQGRDASGLGVYLQRYDAGAKAQGKETLVNKTTVKDQSLPSLAALDNAGFVVAWQSANQDGSGLGVYMQRFTAAGAKTAGETRVNTMTANDQSTPAVAAFSNGGYVVVWASNKQDGSGQGIYAQESRSATRLLERLRREKSREKAPAKSGLSCSQEGGAQAAHAVRRAQAAHGRAATSQAGSRYS
jgi:uncharacterized repeat protein (TIGR03803 family)